MRATSSELYQTELVHRLMPWSVAQTLVRGWAGRVWEREELVREHARWHMRYLLGETVEGPALDVLGKRYVQRTYLRQERWFRPWESTSSPPDGTRQLLQLVQGGRGVVVNFAHHGDFHGPLGAIGQAGVQIHCALDARFFGDDIGAVERQIVRTLTRHGGRVFEARGSRDYIRTLLVGGQVVAIASDVPGRSLVRVLGRRVGMSDGAAQLAIETGAWVVPLTVRRTPRGQVATLGDALDPGDFPETGALLAEMVRRHEAAWAAWPEAMERPLRRWAPQGPDVDLFGWAANADLRI